MSEKKSKSWIVPVILLLVIVAAVVIFMFVIDDDGKKNGSTLKNGQLEVKLTNIDDYIDYVALTQDEYKVDYYTVKIYQAFYDNIDNLMAGTNTISLASYLTSSELNEIGSYMGQAASGALTSLIYDNPELFWLSFDNMVIEATYSSPFSNTVTDITFYVEGKSNFYETGFYSQLQINSAVEQMRLARSEIYAQMETELTENYTDYDAVVYLNDYLTNHVEYDMTLSRNLIHTAYGALVNGIAVCDGYAYALEYLLDGLGITNLVGAGYVADGQSEPEGHMWSYVQLYGNWYGIDVTWNDPVIIDPDATPEEIQHVKDENRHNYLLMGGDYGQGEGFYDEGRYIQNYIYYFGEDYYEFPVPEISKNDFVMPTITSINVTSVYDDGTYLGERVTITGENILDNYTFAYAVSTDGGESYSDFTECSQLFILTENDGDGLYKFRLQTTDGEVILEYQTVITIDVQEASLSLIDTEEILYVNKEIA